MDTAETETEAELTPLESEELATEGGDELPVVARMVVEIRSDGSHTVARGAVEDLLNDQRVAVEAEAGSPLELSRALTKLLLSAPFAARSALLGRERPSSTTSERGGLRGAVGALGRRVGAKLERQLQRRLGDSDED